LEQWLWDTDYSQKVDGDNWTWGIYLVVLEKRLVYGRIVHIIRIWIARDLSRRIWEVIGQDRSGWPGLPFSIIWPIGFYFFSKA